MLETESQVLPGSKAFKSENINTVGRLNLVVVLRVNKGQGKHSLLLQVGFVDTSEGADDNSQSSEISGLESSVLARRTFAIVVVTDDNPFNARVAVGSGSLRNTSPLASVLVLYLVCLVVLSIDGTNQAIFYKNQSNDEAQVDFEERHT